MVGMASLPVRKNHGFRLRLPDLLGQCKTVLDGCGQSRIAEIKPFPELCTDHHSRRFGFLRPEFGRSAGSQLALGEVKNAYGVAFIDHFEEGARTRQFDVVGMRSDGQDVYGLHNFLAFFSNSTSSTWNLNALLPLMNTTGICSP